MNTVLNTVHWHLILNHLPIMATLFGLFIFGYAYWRDKVEVLRVALVLMVFAGAVTIPVSKTGHSAEEIAEKLEAVQHDTIEAHEESAETTYYLALLLGVLALGALIRTYQVEHLSWVILLIIALAGVITLGSFIKTADKGGKIRHPELQIPAGQVESK